MYSSTHHDSRRAFDPYYSAPTSSHQAQHPAQNHYFPDAASSYGVNHPPAPHGLSVAATPTQTHYASSSSSLASALDISRVGTSSRPRPQGETSTNTPVSRSTAFEAINNAPYLNQGALDSSKTPQSTARPSESNNTTAGNGRGEMMIPLQNDGRGVHEHPQQYIYQQQALQEHNLYMEQDNSAGFDLSLWGNFEPMVDNHNAFAHEAMYEQPSSSNMSHSYSMLDTPGPFVGYDQTAGTESYSTWTGFGLLPQSSGLASEGYQDLAAGAWPSQPHASASYPQYSVGTSQQYQQAVGAGAEPQASYGLSHSHMVSAQQQQQQAQALVQRDIHGVRVVYQATTSIAAPATPVRADRPNLAMEAGGGSDARGSDARSASAGASAVASASAHPHAPMSARVEIRKQTLPATVNGHGATGAGSTSGYGMQDYFSQASTGAGGALVQNQSFAAQVQQQPQPHHPYGQPGILEAQVQSFQAHEAPQVQVHFIEGAVAQAVMSSEAQLSSTNSSVRGDMPAQGSAARIPVQRAPGASSTSAVSRAGIERRHTVAVPANADMNGRQAHQQAIAGSSSAPSSPLEMADRVRSGMQSSSSPAGPCTPAPPDFSSFGMGNAMWAQANEFNRHDLVETYHVRHGRSPPRSMKILETTALERSVVGERALWMAMAADMRRRDGEAAILGESGALGDGTADQVGSTAQQQPVDARAGTGANFGPPLPGPELAQGMNGHPLPSPASPTSPDEIMTPRDPFFNACTMQGPTGTAATNGVGEGAGTDAGAANDTDTEPEPRPGSMSPGQPSLFVQKVTPLLRHDGHLYPHVSGLGGLSEAYDGRSYIPDDAELDENHLPRAPPGARFGDHPAIMELRPHPLHVRGETWHAFLQPQPPGMEEIVAAEDGGGDAGEDEEDGDEDAKVKRQQRRFAKLAIKESEKGEGWGFIEGGSHGPGRGLGLPIPEDEDDKEAGKKRRLKLTTDQKNPPKMACHFCRNRKIACGEGKTDATTCNQCERRGLRCIFPTESRRGMRARKPKSGHTVDGVPESVKDADGYGDDDVDGTSFGASSSSLPTPAPTRGRGKGRGRPRGTGRGRGRPSKRGKGRGEAPPDVEHEEPVMEGNDGDIEVDYMMSQELYIGTADPDFGPSVDDPLATVAAQTRSFEQLHGAAPFSIPDAHQFAVAENQNSGPFTRNPLSRRPTAS